MATSITIGFRKVLASIKKVSNKNARSTIGVISILVDIFLLLILIPLALPPQFVLISAIVVVVRR
jgi:hypothetical protein